MQEHSEKLAVSVFIVAQDEAHNMPRLMQSLSTFAEVIVVDSGSQDKTIDIAREFGATVYEQPWLGYAGQKQFALDKCTQPWVLNLDADEVVTDEMLEAIIKFVERDDIDAVRFDRNDLFIGKMPPPSISKPNNVRLYRRKNAQFDTSQQVHETAKIEGQITTTNASFDHYGYDDIQTLVAKTNQYSTLKATEKFNRGKRGSLLKLMLILPLEFLRQYLLKRMFTFGVRGVILAAINAQYAFLKEAKLIEQGLREKQ
ncbi:glycosyltransferase family 2 protein [Alteromonas facilis]|uniref:glycosyltransferase family 2 protein n=1 Tax=Alteromonas facilis TaxID=2048004 RepID=UPI000C28A0F0|nr:glycosyltransferase family 2 protein [Alteromonas facilis]